MTSNLLKEVWLRKINHKAFKKCQDLQMSNIIYNYYGDFNKIGDTTVTINNGLVTIDKSIIISRIVSDINSMQNDIDEMNEITDNIASEIYTFIRNEAKTNLFIFKAVDISHFDETNTLSFTLLYAIIPVQPTLESIRNKDELIKTLLAQQTAIQNAINYLSNT